jgi:hypothetical protein
MNTYGIRDYVDALVTAHRFHRAAPELRHWHARRAEVLGEVFVQGEDPPFAIKSLLERVVGITATTTTPCSGYLEMPPDIDDAVRPHEERLKALQKKTVDGLREMAVALLVLAFPGVDGLTATSAELAARGFDDSSEPDPLDFF